MKPSTTLSRLCTLLSPLARGRQAFAAALAAGLFASTAFAQTPATASLRLDWTTLGYHAPFYYGVEQGIYERAGIKLNIEEGRGSASVAQLAASGNDDFGFSDATTVAQLVDKGLPGKVVMGILRSTTLTMFYAPGRGINKPSDLQGKKVAVCPGDALSAYIPPYLKSLGLKGNEVELLSVDCNLKYTVVAQGRADAVMSYGTAGGPLLQRVGVNNAANFRAGPDFYLPAHGIVVSDKLAQQKPEVIRRFIAATQQAWAAAAKDPDAAVQSILKAKPLLKNEAPVLKETLQLALTYLDAPGSTGQPFGWQSPQDWAKTIGILREYANTTANLTPERVMSNQYLGAQ